jgi:hypothetical protein
MHPELENLLKIALKDGKITDNERDILFRKAEKLGVDIDEFEMELEGYCSSPPEIQKETIMEKPIPASYDKDYIKELTEKLQSIDDEIINPHRTISNVTEGTIDKVIDVFSEVNPIEQGVDAFKSIFGKATSKDKKETAKQQAENQRISFLVNKKATIITTYPLSKHPSDLIELMTLCISNYHSALKGKKRVHNIDERTLMQAWQSKAEQILMSLKLNAYSKELTNQIQEFESKLHPPVPQKSFIQEKPPIKKKKGFWDNF